MGTRTTTRVAAAMLVAGLAASACSGDGDDAEPDEVPVTGTTSPTEGASPSPEPGDTEASPTPDSPPPTTDEAQPSPTETPTTTQPTTSAPTTTEATPGLTPVDDAGDVGVNGRAILRNDRAAMVIEIDAQQGVEPSEEALAHLRTTLEDVAGKPQGIRFEGPDTFTSTTTTWTAEELRATAAEHRTTATTDTEVSIHLLYVAGSHADDEGEQTNAIGLAYSASNAAVFPDRWQGLASVLGSSQAIEEAVLVHELGHLLGLVNLGYTSDLDHEDPDQPGHSANDESVMFHAVETTLIGQVFSGPPPSSFDEADRSDLEGLRTGRL